MSPTERILLWLLVILAVALGGWATYRSNYNFKAGQELTAFVKKEANYTAHLLQDTCHGTGTCPDGGAHVEPPGGPPEW